MKTHITWRVRQLSHLYLIVFLLPLCLKHHYQDLHLAYRKIFNILKGKGLGFIGFKSRFISLLTSLTRFATIILKAQKGRRGYGKDLSGFLIRRKSILLRQTVNNISKENWSRCCSTSTAKWRFSNRLQVASTSFHNRRSKSNSRRTKSSVRHAHTISSDQVLLERKCLKARNEGVNKELQTLKPFPDYSKWRTLLTTRYHERVNQIKPYIQELKGTLKTLHLKSLAYSELDKRQWNQ